MAGRRRVVPGFGLSMGITLFGLGLIVILPLSMLVFQSSTLGFTRFLEIVTDGRVMKSFQLSAVTALIAGFINTIAGLITAWVLVRYRFPFRKVLDGIVDLPFALPTAVAGISLTALFSQNGWIGRWLEAAGIHVVNTAAGITLALVFIGFPFVVRAVQPVLEELQPELEEAALSLGANRWNTFTRVIFPNLVPAILSGFMLSFARAIGEYGSVIFIAGNLPYKTEIAPLIIMSKLDQFDNLGASAVAVTLLGFSFLMLLLLNLVQRWQHGSMHKK